MFTMISNAVPPTIGLALLLGTFFLLGAVMLGQSFRSGDAKKIGARLQALTPAVQARGELRRPRPARSGAMTTFETRFVALPAVRMLEQALAQAGLRWSAQQLLLASSLCGVAAIALIAGAMQASGVIALGLGGLMMSLPVTCVFYRRKKRLRQLAQQIPEMLSYLARYLRTGGSLPVGLRMVGEKMAEPIAGEFRGVHDEIHYGVPVQHALANLAARVPDLDLRNFVTALAISSETGGNIIEILSNLSRLVRERQKLAAKVRVLASDGIFTARLLVCMPFLLAAVLSVVAPKWIAALWEDPNAEPMVQGALAMMALGVFMIRKVIRIRV